MLRYNVAMAAYGFFGDVMQDSEKLRWMGPKRYDLSGFKKFMSNRYKLKTLSLNCTVSYDTVR